MVDWLFRNRRTGAVTVAQLPNLSLSLFGVAALLRLLLAPTGRWHTVLGVVAAVSLVWWALDELLRGVNPFRRLLGATVLAVEVVALLR